MPATRSEMRNPKKTEKRRDLKIFLVILLILFIVLGFFIWKIYNDVAESTERIYKDVETEVVR